jgi:hypothetical protein
MTFYIDRSQPAFGYAAGSSWDDRIADAATNQYGGHSLGDTVTQYNKDAHWSVSMVYNGPLGWQTIGQVLNGNLLVNGTVTADAFVSQQFITDHLAATGINASWINTGSLDAGWITTGVLQASRVDTNNLSVGIGNTRFLMNGGIGHILCIAKLNTYYGGVMAGYNCSESSHSGAPGYQLTVYLNHPRLSGNYVWVPLGLASTGSDPTVTPQIAQTADGISWTIQSKIVWGSVNTSPIYLACINFGM